MDILGYFKGDGRPWGVTTSWAGDSQMQSQNGGLPDQFFLVKGMFGSACPWEEFRSDGNFIYRGFDISSGDGTFYRLTDAGLPVSAWAKRDMAVNDWFQRNPMVTRYNSAGAITFQGPHMTWLQLRAHFPTWTSGRGYNVQDVIEIDVFDGDQGRASGTPFEVYYYAKNIGMVGWRGAINGAPAQMDVNFIWASANVLGAPTLQRKNLPGNLSFDGLPGGGAPPPPPPVGMPRIIRAGIAAKVRQQPTTRSMQIDLLPGGTTVFIVNKVAGQDGDGFHWLERAAGGFIREDLFEGYLPFDPPVGSRGLFAPPVTGYQAWTGYHGPDGHKGVDMGIATGATVTAGGVGQVAFLYTCSKCTADKPSATQQGFQLNDSAILNDVLWGYGFGNGVVVRYAYAELPDSTRALLDQRGQHNAFVYVIHGHMSRVDVIKGQAVGAGSILGLSGETGNTEGQHLHLELHVSLRGDETSTYGKPLMNPVELYAFNPSNFT